MNSSLTWIDHDAKARERTVKILNFYQEKESRDELGLGSIRDSFADQLFPGTSTIQTRLRYMLFVPWIYKDLEDKKTPSDRFAKEADKLERDLIAPLKAAEESEGVIGGRAGKSVVRLPSSVYWAGLGVWGIRITPFSQDDYHKRIDETYRCRKFLEAQKKSSKARGDDGDLGLAGTNWHPQLPPPPDDFYNTVDFALSREEAEFILDRIQVSCPNSLLAFLSLYCNPAEDIRAPWEHPDYGLFPEQHKSLLTQARLFSDVMHGASLSYNIQLARLRDNETLIAKHQASFTEWRENLPLDEIRAWDINQLWAMTSKPGHTITQPTRNFVENWISHVCNSPDNLLSDMKILNLVRNREISLKKNHSRFTNRRTLEQWGGSSGTGRLVYRWPNVQVLLNDLYQGLNREE